MKAQLYFYNRKIIFFLPLCIGPVYLCIRYSQACYEGIASGIGFSLDVLIPSLFALTAAAAIITRSGAGEILCAPLSGLAQAVFRLPGVCLSAIVLGMLGGYPVGAKCVASLYEEGAITQQEAQRTANIAVAAGPGFLIGYIGGALLNNRAVGAILLICQTAAVLLTGWIAGRFSPPPAARPRRKARLNTDDLLVRAVRDASAATLSMCGMVILFSAAASVLHAIIGAGTVCDLLTAVMEITVGCRQLCGAYPIWVIAFFIGFGGLSVHFQIRSVLGDIRIRYRIFFLYRIISGIITALSAYIIIRTFPQSTAVFSSVDVLPSAGISSNLWGSAALAAASVCFLLSITGGNYVRNSRMAQP